MNVKALEVFKGKLIEAKSEYYEEWEVHTTEIVNKAAISADADGYHWVDYPQAWDKARQDIIWSLIPSLSPLTGAFLVPP